MLSILIWLPIFGALLIGLFSGKKITGKQARNGALVVSGMALLWTIWLFTQFKLDFGGFQFHEFLTWLPVLGLNYELSIDGLSLLMVGLKQPDHLDRHLEQSARPGSPEAVLQPDSAGQRWPGRGVYGSEHAAVLPAL